MGSHGSSLTALDLLYRDSPCTYSAAMARALGSVPEAIVIQQVYWRTTKAQYVDTATRSELAESTGFTKPQVRRVVDRLVEKGLLLVYELDDGNPGMSTHTYEVALDVLAGIGSDIGLTNPSSRVTNPSLSCDESVKPSSLRDKVAKATETPSGARREYSKSFEAFWSDYGRKGSKFKTAKQWAKLTADDRRLAHERVPLYFAQKPEVGFRKDAERYLSDRMWDNYDDDGVLVGSGAPGRLKLVVDKCDTCSGAAMIERDDGFMVRCPVCNPDPLADPIEIPTLPSRADLD